MVERIRFGEAREIFEAAVALAPAARSEFLDRACTSAELRAGSTRLLGPLDLSVEGAGLTMIIGILGALARVGFSPQAPIPYPPISPSRCGLVSLRPESAQAFAASYCPPEAQES